MNAESSHFLPEIIVRRWLVMACCVLPNTLKNYASGLTRFTKFCDDFNIKEVDCMPTSDFLLSTFVTTYGAGSVGKGMVKTWLSGLELWHRINSAPWHGGTELQRAVEGSAKLAPSSSHLAKRDPVTIQHLRALHRCLDLTNSFDIAVFAVACIAFWCCCRYVCSLCMTYLTWYRLCELLIDSNFDLSSHVSHSVSIKHRLASNGSPFISLHLPRSKMKENGDELIMTDTQCNCSPTSAFDHHLASNLSLPPSAPLFAFETSEGTWSAMKHKWFLMHCNKIWKQEGLDSIKGHCFRIGGTTHLLLLGIDPWVVMVQGRWSFQCFLSYWRKCKEIVPLFIGFSLQSRESILSTMKIS